MKIHQLSTILVMILAVACSNINPPDPPKAPSEPYAGNLPIDQIELPEGFAIDVYAEDVENARSMDLSPNGTLFVGTRSKGSVYALQDTDGDMRIDKQYELAKKLKLPNGVAFRDGDLYVAEVNRIIKFPDIENNLDNPTFEVIYDEYPTETHHGWKFISFGPDGKLYVPVGAPCNICESEDEVFASLTRMNADGSDMEIIQHGIRNTVGFTWHPETDDLWFTDNGRDWLGDDIPACELNRAAQDNMHFGYPYCHQGDLADPDFGDKKPCSDFTPPVQNLGPHTAPLGLEFVTTSNFPAELQSHVLIAEHGSWNRSKKIGYQVSLVKLDGDQAISYEPFASGWLDKEADEAWGRPVDIEFLPDGTMLVSDDFANAIYRIYYKG